MISLQDCNGFAPFRATTSASHYLLSNEPRDYI
jgi:hypothetical protein